MDIDKILERFNLKYTDLSVAEKETLNSWLEALEKNQVNLDSLKTYISNMKYTVEEELARTTHNSKQDIFLKARLRNYMLLEAFLDSPEKAKKAVESQIKAISKSRQT